MAETIKKSKNRVLPGVNDLLTTHPKIAAEWHPTKNGSLKPSDVARSTHKKVWWLGKCGHEWEAEISHKTNGHNCPYCTSKKVLKGYNDLQTKNPTLAKEWNYERNKGLTPEDVMPNSRKKVWWKCSKGHEWDAAISSRTRGCNCPYCSGKKVLPGYNDLMTKNPKLATEWHPTKNGELTPEMITLKSGKKVWWQCRRGHEWQACIAHRANGSNCPHCSKNGTSITELTLLYYIRKHVPFEAIHKYHNLGFELDIYIPECKVGIEYDGAFYHKNTKKDLIKNKKCFENNIKLYRIREDGLPNLNDSSIDYFYNYKNDKAFSKIISKLLSDISGAKININVTEDFADINDFIKYAEIKNSLAKTHPDIAKEWHPTKNGSLTPEMVSAGSIQKIWWKCELGHEWQTTVNQRTSNKTGCPYCLGQKVWSVFNDLVTTHPAVASHWHPDKNGDLSPYKISAGSARKVEWKCNHCGHEYSRVINAQTTSKYIVRCPHCKTPVSSIKTKN